MSKEHFVPRQAPATQQTESERNAVDEILSVVGQSLFFRRLQNNLRNDIDAVDFANIDDVDIRKARNVIDQVDSTIKVTEQIDYVATADLDQIKPEYGTSKEDRQTGHPVV